MKTLMLVIAMAVSSLSAAAAGAKYIKDLNGKDYFPLGVNYAWIDWSRDFADKGWDERFKKINANLDVMKARGVRTLRWWIYSDFTEAPLWTGKGEKLRCVGLPKGWVKNFMTTVDAAKARGIRLYPVFSSFDLGRKGYKWVVSDKAVRQSFIENAVRPIVQAATKNEGIFAWDIINEPEWLVRVEDNGDPNKELSDGPIKLSELREYIADMVKEIRPSGHPVSLGSAGMKWCGFDYDFFSGLGLDFFDIHYYDWMTPWFNITTTPKSRLAKLNPEYGEKPIIVGESMGQPETEYSGKKRMNHYQFLQAIMKMGYTGYMPWAWNDKPGKGCMNTIDPHFNRALKELKLPGQPAPAVQ